MISIDERLEYYVMVARLMAEADLQMQADSLDSGSRPYSEDLASLRGAVRMAEEAASRIVDDLRATRAQSTMGWEMQARRFARH